jgi:hypothetical protein
MAFNIANLSVLAYANGFTLWHYTTPDAPADVAQEGYFNHASDMFHVGDMLLTNLGVSTPDARGAVFFVGPVVNRVVGLVGLTPSGSAPAALVAAQEAA